MIAYVQQIAAEIARRTERLQLFHDQDSLKNIADRFATLAEELNRLDPRDFLPAAQFEFVECRRESRCLARMQQGEWEECVKRREAMQEGIREKQRSIAASDNDTSDHAHRRRMSVQEDINFCFQEIQKIGNTFGEVKKQCDKIVSVLNMFAGIGSQAVTRPFAFVQDSELRAIVERDYKELTLILLPGHAWKSAVILAGSILEAILFDLLTKDATRMAQAMTSPMAPRKKGGTNKDIAKDTAEDEWKLSDLIKVAAHLSLIPANAENNFHQSLREYRNFVHPRKEIKEDKAVSEAEATLAKGALDLVCNHLS